MTYIQVRIASLFSFEILSRKVQTILQAYPSIAWRPSYEHAQHYSPLGNLVDGIVPELRMH